MKRIGLILGFFVVCLTSVWGQSGKWGYAIHMDVNNTNNRPGKSSGSGTYFHITPIQSNGQELGRILDTGSFRHGKKDWKYYRIGPRNENLSTKISKFKITHRVDWDGGGSNKTNNEVSISNYLTNIKHSYFRACQGSLSSGCYYHQNLFNQMSGHFDVYIFPSNIKIVASENFLPSEDKIEIKAPKGYDESVYRWVYKTSANGARHPISSQDGNSTAIISGKDIYGDNWENEMNFNSNTWIELEYDVYRSASETKVKEYSPPIVLDNYRSAPGILKVDPISPRCNGGDDGMLIVTLDRPIRNGEVINCYYNNKFSKIENIGTIINANNQFKITGLEAGTQNIQLFGYRLYTDGDRHKKKVVIKSPAPLTYKAIDSLHIGCYNDNTGLLKLEATGGNGSYFLHHRRNSPVIERSDSIPFTLGTQTEILGLGFGKHHYYVTDNKGCFMKDENGKNIQRVTEIKQPKDPISIIVDSITHASGFGKDNGEIRLTIKGGTIKDISAPTDQYYTVTCKEKTSGNVIIEERNKKSQSEIMQITASRLKKGTYIFEIKDKHKCVEILEVTIDEPDALTLSSSITQNLCNGDAGAEINISEISGGVLKANESYKIEWSKLNEVTNQYDAYTSNIRNERTGSVISKLKEGQYKIKITDESRIPNVLESFFPITDPTKIAFSVLGSTSVTCHSGNDGTITVQASGGVGRYKVHYQLKGTSSGQLLPFEVGNNELKIENLVAGTYIISLNDGNDCIGHYNLTSETIEVEIKQPQELEITRSSYKNPSGFGLSNGWVTFRISGGTFTHPSGPSYNIQIVDSLYNAIPFLGLEDGQSLLVTIKDLPKGKYTISARDNNYVAGVLSGCVNTLTVPLTEPALLTAKLAITSTVDCNGFNTGVLDVTAKGGHANPDLTQQPYKYKWVKIGDGGTEQNLSFTTATATDLLAGLYKVYVSDYSSPANEVSTQIEIKQPPLLVTTLSTRKISCYGGNDGFIHISTIGGVGGYRLFCKQQGVDKAFAEYAIEADNKTFKLDRLTAGKYEMYILDANNCYAQIRGLDIATIELTQPVRALAITKMSKVEPSGFGLSNGSITLSINGGTPNTDNSYNIVWKNKQGQTILSTTSGDFIGGEFITTLSNQPHGEYTVEVRDGNYNIAFPDANTCCFVVATYNLTEPAKLEVAIEETQVISCNGRSDGELTTHGIGGYRNTDTAQLPYKYKWYKKTESGFIVLPNETSNILKNREEGTYKVEIEDYSRIVNKTSVEYVLVEPDVLQATSTQELITCGQTIDVTALPTGGTLPYRYEWNTGETTQTLSGRYAGKYFAFITDSRGCETTTTAKITTPSDLEITGIYTDPICHQDQNGSITLAVKGGRAPYTYQWSNGATSKDISGIGAGYYTVVVTDRDGCSLSESFILEDPEQLMVNIGEDRTLCNGQELVITPIVKDTNTKFSWTGVNGFTSTQPRVSISKEGNYQLTITDSKGCMASDDINLNVKEMDISSEIVVASQIFVNDTVVIVNISNPEPDRIEWIFNTSDPIKVTQEEEHFAKVVFSKTGNYAVGIRSHVGDCFQEIIKTITVVEEDDILSDRFGESLIKDFHITPNPNDGNFEAIVNLNKESVIRLRVVNLWNGTTADDRTLSGQEAYRVNYSLNLAHANMYLVLLETSSGKMVQRMIVK